MEITDKDVDTLYDRLVKVIWVDIIVSGGWVNKDKLAEEVSKPFECCSYGYLSQIAETYIVVSATKGGDEFNQHITIPLGVVKEIVLV